MKVPYFFSHSNKRKREWKVAHKKKKKNETDFILNQMDDDGFHLAQYSSTILMDDHDFQPKVPLKLAQNSYFNFLLQTCCMYPEFRRRVASIEVEGLEDRSVKLCLGYLEGF